MAHHSTTSRRMLASSQQPEAKLKPTHQSSSSSSASSAMDPTTKAHHQTKTMNPDPPTKRPTSSFMSNYLSSRLLNPLSHNNHRPSKNPPPELQSMTVSADFDSSSRFSAARAKYYAHHKETLKRVVGKEEALHKDKVKKCPSLDLDVGLVVEEKKKVLVLNETKKTRKKNVKKPKDDEDGWVKSGSGKEMKMMMKKDDVLLLEGLDIKRMSLSGGGDGRRRSLSGTSQVELVDFLASNGAKIVSVDMPPFMQIHAIDCARKTCDSLEKFAAKTLALTLKKEFDGVYGPAWHCIVGTSFGSFVTHSVGGFLYFSMDSKLYVLLFKTTVQRAAD